jgi:surface protein
MNNNATHKNKLLSIDQWGDNKWTTMNKAFFGCENLQMSATDVPDLTQVKDMTSMFQNATNFNGDVSKWNVENVTNMQQMFQ